ncbi:hypothetical protein [Nissabacter sp. SGAir0207]|uniref:hypothetical protein n=1 Tax=Nissabacter sp. SGAir0207 TaxID=2126321 RepID=UPI0010CCB6AD|nr:hypothetical protein [Nissabacter sp. SGAir0207]QCR38755.1 hypothetical protein C1N62_21745 [Nissabacter sp. SGAir0207]
MKQHHKISQADIAAQDEARRIISFAETLLMKVQRHPGRVASAYVPDLQAYEIYLRMKDGTAQLHGLDVLVVANISAAKPGTGGFTLLLHQLKTYAEQRRWVLKVENVLDARFRAFLEKEGFVFPDVGMHYHGSGYWAAKGVMSTEELVALR